MFLPVSIKLLWVTVPTPSYQILLSICVFCKVVLLLGCLCTCVLCVDIILWVFFSDMLDLSNCSLLSLNVRGLKSQLKRRSIFSYLKSQKCLFYLLKETYSEPKDEVEWKNEWDQSSERSLYSD